MLFKHHLNIRKAPRFHQSIRTHHTCLYVRFAYAYTYGSRMFIRTVHACLYVRFTHAYMYGLRMLIRTVHADL